jgi:hypothetical protein
MVSTLQSPALVGSRDLAREFLRDLPSDLADAQVVINCANVEASAPSFVDEVVKVVLVERAASHLLFSHAPKRTAEYAQRSAVSRGVDDRLTVEVRHPH